VDYECFRKKLLASISDNGSDKWLNSDEMMILLAAELGFVCKKKKINLFLRNNQNSK
jgi:hypothetical protein